MGNPLFLDKEQNLKLVQLLNKIIINKIFLVFEILSLYIIIFKLFLY